MSCKAKHLSTASIVPYDSIICTIISTYTCKRWRYYGMVVRNETNKFFNYFRYTTPNREIRRHCGRAAQFISKNYCISSELLATLCPI